MLAHTGEGIQEMRSDPALGSWLSMTKGHRHKQPGIGSMLAPCGMVLNVMRRACLRRILLTSLHIGVRHQRRTRSAIRHSVGGLAEAHSLRRRRRGALRKRG
jgi:hypothetical protein